jgi:hypothetical protein
MIKNNKQISILILVLLVFVSPILWIVLGNIPTDFDSTLSWTFLMTFAVLAFAVYVASGSDKK